MYFTLKDEEASIDAVMYRTSNANMDFRPSHGMKVLARGRISVFIKGGRYQIIVWEMKQKGTGELEKRFLELKEKLKKEGLFDQKFKKPIPAVPQLIGIITSPTGAAIRDILNVIGRRFAKVKIVIFPVRVQGGTAKDEIATAIDKLNALYPKMDVIILARGGGSLEDLWPFNEEAVARAIFRSSIPIISGVGHEVDFTIADFAADFRAPTPSAAAEIAVEDSENLRKRLYKSSDTLRSYIGYKIKLLSGSLNAVRESAGFRYPDRLLNQKYQDMDYIIADILNNVKSIIRKKTSAFDTLTAGLEALSPMAVLDRGYSITYRNKEVLKDTSCVKEGDSIYTVVKKGRIKSRVEELD